MARPKITLIEVVKNDVSIKKVIENMILDKIEWQESIHVLILTSRLKIHVQLQNYRIKVWLLLNV